MDIRYQKLFQNGRNLGRVIGAAMSATGVCIAFIIINSTSFGLILSLTAVIIIINLGMYLYIKFLIQNLCVECGEEAKHSLTREVHSNKGTVKTRTLRYCSICFSKANNNN